MMMDSTLQAVGSVNATATIATTVLHGCYTDATRMLRDPWQCEGNATEKRSRQTGTMYYGTCLRALLGNTLYMDLQSAARVS